MRLWEGVGGVQGEDVIGRLFRVEDGECRMRMSGGAIRVGSRLVVWQCKGVACVVRVSGWSV
ncbi:hypothetical protein ABID23_001584 [Bartonella silvatica]|uniref:Uncharacterized protein n=1 Tax=Bartonella silvatica TaxID=357760 RepID=A0ABV2HIT2_9HYPH